MSLHTEIRCALGALSASHRLLRSYLLTGKFLAEERLLGDYSLEGPVPELFFKYKQRIYKVKPMTPEKQLAKLNSRIGQKKVCVLQAPRATADSAQATPSPLNELLPHTSQFMEYVRKGNVAKAVDNLEKV